MIQRAFKLGKKPAAKVFKGPRFGDYATAALPAAPASWSHCGHVSEWLVLANDTIGDCTIAGPLHQFMAARSCNGISIAFNDSEAIGVYSAISGYDPRRTDARGDNPTDTGCDMADVARHLLNVGVFDVSGDLLKIDAWASVNPRDLKQLATAAWLFCGVQLGVMLPESAQDQTAAGKPWAVTDAEIDGGHDVYLINRLANGNWQCVTWGQLQEVTPEFITTYADEAIAYLMEEDLTKGKSPEGFDLARLKADLSSVR
jgi:hypothetical protein